VLFSGSRASSERGYVESVGVSAGSTVTVGVSVGVGDWVAVAVGVAGSLVGV
jgi:hypothetical protein